jgi:hypothetical protein
MTELRDLHAGVGDRDGAALLEALEEPLLHRVVVQRPVNVHWSNGSPCNSLALQQCLSIQLPFVSALGIHGVNLPKPRTDGLISHRLQQMQRDEHRLEFQRQTDQITSKCGS